MLKKSLYVGGGVALLLALLFGRDAMSYVCTSISEVRQMAKDNVPVEYEIERAEQMIEGINPEIRRSMHLIAKEKVEVKRLEDRIVDLEKKLDKDESSIKKLQADYDSGEQYVYYKNTRFSRSHVKADLENRFERFKTNDATLAQLNKVLHARKKALAAAEVKLDDMVASRTQLQDEVKHLRARLDLVEVAKSTSSFEFDDSHLSRTRGLIDEIQARIETEETLVNTYGEYDAQIPVEADDVDSVSVSDKITAYFATERPLVDEYAAAE